MIEGFTDSADIKQRKIQSKIKCELQNKQRDNYLFNRLCFAACVPIVIILILVFMAHPKALTSDNYLLLILGAFFLFITITSARKIMKYDDKKIKNNSYH